MPPQHRTQEALQPQHLRRRRDRARACIGSGLVLLLASGVSATAQRGTAHSPSDAVGSAGSDSVRSADPDPRIELPIPVDDTSNSSDTTGPSDTTSGPGESTTTGPPGETTTTGPTETTTGSTLPLLPALIISRGQESADIVFSDNCVGPDSTGFRFLTSTEFILERSGPLDDPLTVPLATIVRNYVVVSGGGGLHGSIDEVPVGPATHTPDPLPTEITIPAGEPAATLTVTPLTNTVRPLLVEILATIGPVPGYDIVDDVDRIRFASEFSDETAPCTVLRVADNDPFGEQLQIEVGGSLPDHGYEVCVLRGSDCEPLDLSEQTFTVTHSVSAGSLPPGITLNPTIGYRDGNAGGALFAGIATTPGAYEATITACWDETATCSLVFDVTVAVTGSSGPGPDDELPFTGSTSTGLAVIGAALVLVGLLGRFGRRREAPA